MSASPTTALQRGEIVARVRSAIPSWAMITTKQLELRRRRGLMIAVLLLTLGLPVIILGIRLIFHAVDPHSYGPAGSPGVFDGLCNPMAEFGFIMAATLGATAGTSDLTEGVFRHLVITGRSRLALYLQRIPAGLSIVLPLVALAFTFLCLVTSYEGTPSPTSVTLQGVTLPLNLTESQFVTWLADHPSEVNQALRQSGLSASTITSTKAAQVVDTAYANYVSDEPAQLNPAINEMVKIGLWIELEVGIGFMVGLGLGSLIGQRTVTAIMMIALEIIITPILANVTIPYFLNGQRLIVGVAMDQLRPAGLAATVNRNGAHPLFGGRGELGIPPMPTWAMITVIVVWIVGWSVIGAWKMMTPRRVIASTLSSYSSAR